MIMVNNRSRMDRGARVNQKARAALVMVTRSTQVTDASRQVCLFSHREESGSTGFLSHSNMMLTTVRGFVVLLVVPSLARAASAVLSGECQIR
jgi:hypothetical protein